MPESTAPAFVKIEYSSSNAPHVMILPTLGWNDPGDGTDGSFDAHAGGTVSAILMVTALLNELRQFFTADAEFTAFTIFTQATPTSDPVPRFSNSLSIPGTTVSASWQKAVQLTMTARTTNFGIAKIVTLDAISNDDWDKIVGLGAGSAEEDVFLEWSDPSNGWAGRDNGRPNVFLQLSKTLNEKLRRQYHMT